MAIVPFPAGSLGSKDPGPGGTSSFYDSYETIAMTDEADILRKQPGVRDALRSTPSGWQTVEFGVPCNLQSVTSQSEKAEASAIASRSVWRCFFPVGTDIMPEDKVVIKGETYQVVETDKGMTHKIRLTATLVLTRRMT